MRDFDPDAFERFIDELIPDDDTPLVLQPGHQALDLPTPLVSSQRPS